MVETFRADAMAETEDASLRTAIRVPSCLSGVLLVCLILGGVSVAACDMGGEQGREGAAPGLIELPDNDELPGTFYLEPEHPGPTASSEELTRYEDAINKVGRGVFKRDPGDGRLLVFVASTAVTDSALERLGDIQELRGVRLDSCHRFTDEGVGHVAQIEGLTELSLGDTKLTNACLQHVKKLTHLKKLVLWDSGVTPSGFSHLAGMNSLRHLNLSVKGVTDESLADLASLTSLVSLDISESLHVGDAGLLHLKDMTALKYLHLWGSRLTDRGLATLGSLTELVVLYLGNSKSITNDGLRSLKTLVKLQDLSVYGCVNIGDVGVEHLRGMNELRRLGLDDTLVTDSCLATLKTLPKLEELGLTHCKGITDIGLKVLAEFEGLKELSVLSTGATPEGIAKLKKALPDCDMN